jgi:hypothetical protein
MFWSGHRGSAWTQTGSGPDLISMFSEPTYRGLVACFCELARRPTLWDWAEVFCPVGPG